MTDSIARKSTPRWRWVALSVVALVPLAFAGLSMASLGDANDGVDRIPAAIVNQDEMVTTTSADGTEQPVLAGRLLVTELTGDDAPGMAWELTNAEDAEQALADGEVYAVLTIPSDFSASVVSLQSADPTQAELSIRTDDAHSYLAGSVAQSLGDGMVRAFGTQITEQYIGGIYAQFGELGSSLAQASDGAAQLADGATQASGGASSLATGLGSYTGGVRSLATGLGELSAGAGGLDQLSSGVSGYTGGVAAISAQLQSATAALAANPADPVALATVQALSGQLAGLSAQGPALAGGLTTAIDGVQGGIAQSASGARTLANNGPALVSGAEGLAGGTGQLASGATELATGLKSGADQLPAADSDQAADAASVVAEPVTLEVSTDNAISSAAQAIGTYAVPLGLWIGALAIFLVMRPVSRRVLASTAASGRVIGSTLARAGLIAAAQAALLVLLLHLMAGVGWQFLPATLAFSLVAAAAFTAFHYLLTIGLGRAGLVISLFLLAVQLASTGTLFPSQALAGPFSWLSSVLPLSWATTGMQQIITGGSAGTAIAAAFGLLAFGVASVAVAAIAIRRTRRAKALGLLLPGTA
jgi:putative membrane protein